MSLIFKPSTTSLQICRARRGVWAPWLAELQLVIDDFQRDSEETGAADPKSIFVRVEARSQYEERMKALAVRKRKSYKVAVVGISGCGKSSLVNALRGTDDWDERNAAPVGERETTMNARPYPDPRNEHIVYWDIPGWGTAVNPTAGYFKRHALFLFDALIIVMYRDLREVDLQVAREARTFNLPVYFVRSRSDESVRNVKRSTRCTEAEAVEVLRALVKKQQQQLHTKGFLDQRLFLVCADRMRDFINGCHEGLLDEAELMGAIVHPAILFKMPNTTEG